MSGIVHVVLVSFAAHATGDDRSAVAEGLRRLPATVPGILELHEGASVSPEGLEGGFDYGFVMRFASAADRDAYLVHPDHQAYGRTLGAMSDRVVVFDIPSSGKIRAGERRADDRPGEQDDTTRA